MSFLGGWLGKKLIKLVGKLAEAVVIHQLAAWIIGWLKTFAEPPKKSS